MHAPTGNAAPPRSVLDRLLLRSWDYRHPRVWPSVRLAAGIWLVFVGGLLLADGYLWATRAAAGGGGALLGRLPGHDSRPLRTSPTLRWPPCSQRWASPCAPASSWPFGWPVRCTTPFVSA